MKLSEHLACIAAAATAEALEVATQNAWKAFPRGRSHDRVSRAMRTRGRALCASHPRGQLIPSLGPRRKLTVCGQTRSVGYGGNGAGERYAWHYAKEWAMPVLEEAGVAEDLRRQIWDWWSDYPHRALSAVESWPDEREARP